MISRISAHRPIEHNQAGSFVLGSPIYKRFAGVDRLQLIVVVDTHAFLLARARMIILVASLLLLFCFSSSCFSFSLAHENCEQYMEKCKLNNVMPIQSRSSK